MSDPSGVLREAAQHLRQLAFSASELHSLPWSIKPDPEFDLAFVNGADGDSLADVCLEGGGTFTLEAARWVVAMSPAVAEPLASWLEKEADSAEHHVKAWKNRHVPDPKLGGYTVFDEGRPGPISDDELSRNIEHHYGHALALASAVLGADR
ncbi:hypothetical protein [Prauserella endophytica]|uniref:DinB family protein n=1 Tax=Prauserella endophytica TaxID=1592324 RepID=A0ABY2RSQ6_9PSEU|nr:hypothetical protein [Prauserella endophytica]TKG58874.1 hypothetical protein FCN18_37295 [Prauserella endophytica]